MISESPFQSPVLGEVKSPEPAILYGKSSEVQKGEMKMERMIEMWLNPINLGILFLCLTVGIWILSKSGPNTRDK